MTWLSYVYPQTIARFSSPYNKDIRVVEEWGRCKLLVNGSPQSGPYIERIWRAAFRSFAINSDLPVESILVFGIAGGTVIGMLRNLYADAYIRAIDIDARMIAIGKQFFGLNRISDLKLIRADAKTFVPAQIRSKRHYDLIIVDLSFGRHIPLFVTTQHFLLQLSKLQSPTGTIVINFLREREYLEQSEKLKQTLQHIYQTVREKAIFLNRFFCVR